MAFNNQELSAKLSGDKRCMGAPQNEKNSAQIGEVWDVLVKQSRNFYQFTRWGSWGICRKKISSKDRVIGLIK